MATQTIAKTLVAAGPFVTPAWDIRPFGTPNRLSADAIMDAADISDPTLSIPIALEASFDNGSTWKEQTSNIWRGGSIGKNGQPRPMFVDYSTSTGWPTHLRCRLTLPKALNLGVNLNVL